MVFRALLVFGLLFTQAAYANLRDPTRPDNFQEAAAGQLPGGELQAIIISKERRVAIFDGQTLTLGSQFAGFKVVAINPNTVHLEGPDGKMILFLFNQTIKRSVAKPI
jgi:MSHA biogenesis protein MshK